MQQNLLSSKERIKNSIINRAIKMWNISDLSKMDPLVKLLIDAMSFELSKVGQSITISNRKILETLSSLLVPGEKLLASPAHAVMKVLPFDRDVTIKPRNQFYLPNGLKDVTLGKLQGDLYFSSIDEIPLINAQVKWMVNEKTIYQIVDGVYKDGVGYTKMDYQFPDGEVWVGIEQYEVSQTINQVRFFFDIMGDFELNELLRFNEQILFDISKGNGEFLRMQHVEPETKTNKSFARQDAISDINAFYANRFVTQSVGKKPFLINYEVVENYPKEFENYFSEDTLENNFDIPCLWIKIQFPEIFDRKLLAKFKILLNCFVVVNKRLSKFQHNLNRSGTILPLETLLGEQFLAVGEVTDQRDVAYRELPNVDIGEMSNSYKVYYGGLESFDLRKGMLMLEQLTFKVREEGQAFSSMAQDTVLIHLKELYENLSVLEGKMKRMKTNSESNFNSYIQTFPHEESHWIEYEYWTTNTEYGNGLDIGTELQQYRIASQLHPNSIQLVTSSLGGKSAPENEEKVNELRHLILSKSRLVSWSDLNNYIEKEIGHLLSKVEIKPGVQIDPHRKKGLIRVTDIVLSPKNSQYSSEQWKIISNGLEKQIRKKAIRGQQYYVSVKAS